MSEPLTLIANLHNNEVDCANRNLDVAHVEDLIERIRHFRDGTFNLIHCEGIVADVAYNIQQTHAERIGIDVWTADFSASQYGAIRTVTLFDGPQAKYMRIGDRVEVLAHTREQGALRPLFVMNHTQGIGYRREELQRFIRTGEGEDEIIQRVGKETTGYENIAEIPFMNLAQQLRHTLRTWIR